MAKRFPRDEYSRSGAAALLWPLGAIGAFVLLDWSGSGYFLLVYLLGGLALAAAYFGKTMIEFRVFHHWLIPALGVGIGVLVIASYDEPLSARFDHYVDAFDSDPAEAFKVALLASILVALFVLSRFPAQGEVAEETSQSGAERTEKWVRWPQLITALGVYWIFVLVLPKILDAQYFDRPYFLYVAAALAGVAMIWAHILYWRDQATTGKRHWSNVVFYVLAAVFYLLIFASGPRAASGRFVPVLEWLSSTEGILVGLAIFLVPLILLAVYDRRRAGYQ